MSSSSPVWDDAKFARYPRVTKNLTFDVVVIGGGITGLTAAYLLKKAGKRVCLLERTRLGQGDTGCTTAHLTSVTDLRLAPMARQFGKDTARAVWASGAVAMNTIEDIAREEAIDCEFRRVPGFLHASLEVGDAKPGTLQADFDMSRELGIDATFLKSVPLVNRPGIRFSNQAKFHPLKYLSALAKIIHGDGCSIFEQSEAEDFLQRPWGVKANGRHIRCSYIVIATHVPLQGKTGLVSAMLLQSKLAPYSSYVISAQIAAGHWHEACYWDTSDPYYYLRIDQRPQGAYAIFGGQDHKTGQADNTAERFALLGQRLQKILPQAKIDRHWSGQVVETNDGLPYIGETAERQFVATGYGGNGMTFGTVAALMARDAVLGRTHPWQDLFNVSRKKIRGGLWHYLAENLDYPLFLVGDRMKRSEVPTPADVPQQSGRVLLIDGQRVACARDEGGHLLGVSAVCTHMGCIVRWNTAERTWDCPCHGSRFKITGEVIAGPAEEPLKVINVQDNAKRLPPSKARGKRQRKRPGARGTRRARS